MALRRRQLFEGNDAAMTPAPLRDVIVETLSRTLAWGRMLADLVGPLRAFVAATGATELLDVCAGAGGPAAVLVDELVRHGGAPRFVLTDLFPRPAAWERLRRARPDHLAYVPTPIDATAIPPDVSRGRARVVVNAFHHFPPPLAQAIIDDAVASGAGLFISEAFERNPLAFARFAPAGLAALAAAPLLTDTDRLAKAFYTWATPIALAAGTFDGLVSTLRIYDEADLRAMVARHGDHYRWHHGTYRYPLGGVGTYFWGAPA